MRRGLLSLAAVVAAAACGGPSATWRDVSARPWLELRSDAFVMATDLSEREARARFGELAALREAVLEHIGLVFPGAHPHLAPFRVVHLRSCGDVRRVHDIAAGFVTRARDWSGMTLMVTCENQVLGRSLLVHELTHVVVRAVLPAGDPWLQEGLAQYYETIRIERGQVVIGAVPKRGAAGRFVPIETVRKLRAAFYGPTIQHNYVAAWRLVHLLNSRHHHAAFVRYLTALRSGASEDAAWAASFGDVAGKLEARYRDYGSGMLLDVYRGKDRSQGSPATRPAVRTLRRGEIHAVWLDMLLSSGVTRSDARGAAATHIRMLEAEDPGWSGATFWKAVVVAWHGGRPRRGEAEKLLRAYVAAEPRDERGWTALVSVADSRIVPLDHDPITDKPPARLGAIAHDVHRLLTVATTSNALNTAAWYYALTRQPEVGLALAQQAVTAEPTCGACYDTWALLLAQAGELDAAVVAAERAVAMYLEAGVPDDVARRLDQLRRMRAARGRGR